MVGQNFKSMDDLLKCTSEQLEGKSIDKILDICNSVCFFCKFKLNHCFHNDYFH